MRQPNIVVFQTDDQTVQDLSVMPGVQALIARQGVTFNQMVTPRSPFVARPEQPK